MAATLASVWSRHTWFGPSSLHRGEGEGGHIAFGAFGAFVAGAVDAGEPRRRPAAREALWCLLFRGGETKARREKPRATVRAEQGARAFGSTSRTCRGSSGAQSARAPLVHRRRRRRRRARRRSRSRRRVASGGGTAAADDTRHRESRAREARREVAVERGRGPRSGGSVRDETRDAPGEDALETCGSECQEDTHIDLRVPIAGKVDTRALVRGWRSRFVHWANSQANRFCRFIHFFPRDPCGAIRRRAAMATACPQAMRAVSTASRRAFVASHVSEQARPASSAHPHAARRRGGDGRRHPRRRALAVPVAEAPDAVPPAPR